MGIEPLGMAPPHGGRGAVTLSPRTALSFCAICRPLEKLLLKVTPLKNAAPTFAVLFVSIRNPPFAALLLYEPPVTVRVVIAAVEAALEWSSALNAFAPVVPVTVSLTKETAFLVSVRMTAAVWPSLTPPAFPVIEQLVREKPSTPVPLMAPAELF